MNEPRLSVVVPTYGSGASIEELVLALEQSNFDGEIELVIVDDCSTDDTWFVLRHLASDPGRRVRLRILRQPENRGPAAARNVGWRAASAPLVAFTDDDCRPSPDWLRALAEGLDGADLVQGTTIPNPAQAGQRGAFSHWIEVTSENGHYETCNMGYRREVLEAIGGFDETFRQAFGEDLDAARRALALGFRATFRADALVVHDVTRSDWRSYIRRKGRRFDFVLLCRRYPDLRHELVFGVFTHPTAIAVGVLVALAIVQRHSPLTWAMPAVLVAKYVADTVADAPPPRRRWGWLGVIPVRFVADWYDVVVMTRASLHHRTLVL